jgi:hypothetical protein
MAALQIVLTDAPFGLVRVETRADGTADPVVRYLARREEHPQIIKMQRQSDGFPVLDVEGWQVFVNVVEERVEILIAKESRSPRIAA